MTCSMACKTQSGDCRPQQTNRRYKGPIPGTPSRNPFEGRFLGDVTESRVDISGHGTGSS